MEKIYLSQNDVNILKSKTGKKVYFAQYVLSHLTQDEKGWLLDEDLAKDVHLVENLEHILGRDILPPPIPFNKYIFWKDEDEDIELLNKKYLGGKPSKKIINKIIYQIMNNDIEHLEQTLKVATLSEINSLSKNSMSPLCLAIKMKKYQIVKLLLEEGADVNIHAEDYPSALELAIKNKDYEMAMLLLDYGADPDEGSIIGMPLILACKQNNENMVASLLDYGAEPDAVFETENGEFVTPLSICAINNNLKIAKILLDFNADPSFVEDEEYLSDEFKKLLLKYR
jgi:hypothetical protein